MGKYLLCLSWLIFLKFLVANICTKSGKIIQHFQKMNQLKQQYIFNSSILVVSYALPLQCYLYSFLAFTTSIWM